MCWKLAWKISFLGPAILAGTSADRTTGPCAQRIKRPRPKYQQASSFAAPELPSVEWNWHQSATKSGSVDGPIAVLRRAEPDDCFHTADVVTTSQHFCDRQKRDVKLRWSVVTNRPPRMLQPSPATAISARERQAPRYIGRTDSVRSGNVIGRRSSDYAHYRQGSSMWRSPAGICTERVTRWRNQTARSCLRMMMNIFPFCPCGRNGAGGST